MESKSAIDLLEQLLNHAKSDAEILHSEFCGTVEKGCPRDAAILIEVESLLTELAKK